VKEKFGKFLEFPEKPLTSDLVLSKCDALVRKIDELTERSNRLDGCLQELAKIRSKLGVPTDVPASQVRAELDEGWEDWAVRLYAMATDDFSIGKYGISLRAALEEAVRGGAVQTRLSRKMEILRFEKRLLAEKKLPERGSGPPSLEGLVAVGMAVARLMKLSKHLQFTVRKQRTSA